MEDHVHHLQELESPNRPEDSDTDPNYITGSGSTLVSPGRHSYRSITDRLHFLDGSKEIDKLPVHLLAEIQRHLQITPSGTLSCTRKMRARNNLNGDEAAAFVIPGSSVKVLAARFQWSQRLEFFVVKQRNGTGFMNGKAAIVAHCGERVGLRTKWHVWDHTCKEGQHPPNAQWVERLRRPKRPSQQPEHVDHNSRNILESRNSPLLGTSDWGGRNGGRHEPASVRPQPTNSTTARHSDHRSSVEEEDHGDEHFDTNLVIRKSCPERSSRRSLRSTINAVRYNNTSSEGDFEHEDRSGSSEADESAIDRDLPGGSEVAGAGRTRYATAHQTPNPHGNHSSSNLIQRPASGSDALVPGISSGRVARNGRQSSHLEPVFVFRRRDNDTRETRTKSLSQCHNVTELFKNAWIHGDAHFDTEILEIEICGVNSECHQIIRGDVEDFNFVVTKLHQLSKTTCSKALVRRYVLQ